MTCVIALAGPIGAGKSAVAARLAVALGAERRSFGRVVRARALERGLDTDRQTLQELGEAMIASDGWVTFCQAVLAGSTADAIVVDGVRHVGAVEALRSLAGRQLFALIYVDAPRERRLARLRKRDHISSQAVADAEAHPNESELPLVRERANITVSNTGEDADSVHHLVATIARELRQMGSGPPT